VLGSPFKGPRKHYRPKGEPFIPFEFSGAAFRFGHSMVRPDYGVQLLPESVTEAGVGAVHLFPDLVGFGPLQHEVAWERFFKMVERAPQDSSAIDVRLAPPLFDLPFFTDERVLARRNLLRGIKLKLPSGQALAAKLNTPKLDAKDLHIEDVAEPMKSNLAASTPLWYWILCEAEKGGGFHLGPLGGLIVGEVLTGLIETDPTSYLQRDPGWEPGILGGTKGQFSMASLVRYARGEKPL
jgi:hypothetical protein